MDQLDTETENERKCREKAIQAREARWFDWKYRFASADVWTEPMLTGLREGIKGKKWYSLADKIWSERSLRSAYARVKKNKGSAGSDGQSITAFGACLESNVGRLTGELQSGRYRRQAIKRVEIPKADGKRRPLGIPSVRDRVVEASIKAAIEPIYDVDFHPHSFGFRPGLGCKDALQAVRDHLDAGQPWVVDADIQSYFDNIDHDILLSRVADKVNDGRVIRWLSKALETPIFDGLDQWTPEKGSPQGSILSPLLANIYLDDLDWVLERADITFVRYADDFVLLCDSREQAEAGLALVASWCQENALTLHPEKTHLLEVTRQDGFDFLGYHFRAGNHWPSDKGRKNLRTKLRPLTKRNNGKSIERIIEEITPVIRGWFHYFKYCRRWQLEKMDRWIRGRLRSINRRRQKKKGKANGHDHQRWPNSYFEARGLFSLVAAHETFCESHEEIPRWHLPDLLNGPH